MQNIFDNLSHFIELFTKVLDTLEEKAEYLQAHMECLLQPQNTNTTAASMADEEEDEIDEGFARVMEQQTNPRFV